MHNYTLITKLFSRYFKKYIIQCRKLRENPAKCEILALKVIQKPDQVMPVSYTHLCSHMRAL